MSGCIGTQIFDLLVCGSQSTSVIPEANVMGNLHLLSESDVEYLSLWISSVLVIVAEPITAILTSIEHLESFGMSFLRIGSNS